MADNSKIRARQFVTSFSASGQTNFCPGQSWQDSLPHRDLGVTED